MSRIGQKQAAQSFIQSNRSQGTGKSKSKSRSGGTNQLGKSLKSGSKGRTGCLDDLPSVGMDILDGTEPVERYMGGSASYTNDAVDQHNELGAKAARGKLIAQQGQTPNQQQLSRQVDTLKARLNKLETQLDQVGSTSPMQETKRVSTSRQRVNHAHETTVQKQSHLQTTDIASITDKQKQNLLDDDLPRVGLFK